jgi:methanethiol S-methyltransferase
MKYYHLENCVPGVLTLLSMYITVHFFHSNISYYTGIVFVTVGLVLWWAGKIALGDAFAAMPAAKKLVTNGIYAKIRHPIYLGITLMLFGYVFIIDTYLVRLITVLVILSFLIRIFFEEKKLRRAFGKKYELYRKKTLF